MTTNRKGTGSDLFIVDNSDDDWKVVRYLHQWTEIAHQIDIATGYFEIGALLALDGQWQKLDKIRLLMGDEVSLRTKQAFEAGLTNITGRLNHSLEAAKEKDDFLTAGQASPLQSPITAFVERQTGATLGSMTKSKAYDAGKVYLDTSATPRSSYFEGIPEEVWHFHIGGYQVCHKWLYDRRGKKGEPGRTLTPEDIAH